jgi:hypothetical protein
MHCTSNRHFILGGVEVLETSVPAIAELYMYFYIFQYSVVYTDFLFLSYWTLKAYKHILEVHFGKQEKALLIHLLVKSLTLVTLMHSHIHYSNLKVKLNCRIYVMNLPITEKG